MSFIHGLQLKGCRYNFNAVLLSLMIFPLSPGAESPILSQENDSATHFLQYNRVRVIKGMGKNEMARFRIWSSISTGLCLRLQGGRISQVRCLLLVHLVL